MPDLSTAFTPIRIGPVTLRNRFIRAGANEGMTPAGVPTRGLVENHRAMARGGVGMTTMAYGAVSEAGRTFKHQCVINRDALPHLRVLTDAVHAEGAAACLQITHAGAFTQLWPRHGFTPPSASMGVNLPGLLFGIPFKHRASTAELAALALEFAGAAEVAAEAGFDAVEIHMGHGYLLNQFTSPIDNHRRDFFGGSARNRARFPGHVVRAVRAKLGGRIAVCAKINVTDGTRRGVTPADVVTLARVLQEEGVDLITLSGGRNAESPWVLFSGPLPAAELQRVAPGLANRLGFMALNWQQPRNVEFREVYFLDEARAVRAAVNVPLSLVGGVKSRDGVARAMQEGFDCVSLARALIHDPGFVGKLQREEVAVSGCTACNLCVAGLYTKAGTDCVLHPANDAALNDVAAAPK
jgi:2,4-dienoyl-CoA reductase-like NADH-dependent reductase (Old Yellow Enzyme family)